MAKIKETLYRFFQGRYGPDSLNNFLLWVYFVSVIINLFTSIRISYIGFLCLFVVIYRMLSKNIYKRRQENIKFFNAKQKLKQKFNLLRDKWKFRKTHIFRKCPNCKVVLKLPRKKGKHTCCCPKCKNNFKVYCG